jgi:Bacteriophage head to tail connecting protein
MSDTAAYEDSGPALLSAQPLTRKPDPISDPKWDTLFTLCEAKLASLRSWRWSKWALWQVLGRYFQPFRNIWIVVANKMTRGHYVNEAIIDSTGLQSIRTAAGGIWSGLTSSFRPWFKIDLALPWLELDEDGKAWLQDTQDRIYAAMAGSNFYAQLAQAFKDLVTFGTTIVIIYEDFQQLIRLYVPCAGEYYIDVGGRLEVDTLYREFTYNVQQTVDFFKIENCPEQVVRLWEQQGASLQYEFVIAHCIEPNTPVAKPGRRNAPPEFLVPRTFSYREIYWLRGIKTERPLSSKGFNLKPFLAFRWSTVSNDPYGHGPCEDCIGDNKQLQLQSIRKAEFIDKGVRPPMGASPELRNEPATIIAGQVTYVTSEKGFWPLFEPNPVWLSGLTQDIGMVCQRIKDCLYVNLFMAISQMEGVQPRNEKELNFRDLERLQELGPVIELAEKELNEAILRILNILTRRRMLRPVPPSLRDVPLKITYTSIMRIAQQANQSIAMKDIIQVGGALSSAAKAATLPDPLRTVNLDWFLRHYAELNNGPSKMFYSNGEVAKHDKIRTMEMQKAQIPGQAMAGVQAAKTLSETPTGPGSALSALLGQQGQ